MENLNLEYLECPECNKQIRVADWFDHNKKVFNNEFEKKYNKYKEQNINEFEKRYEKQKQLEISNISATLEKRFTAEINDLKNKANLKSNEFELFKKSVEEQKQLEISNISATLEKKFVDEINELRNQANLKSNELKLFKKSVEEQKQLEISNISATLEKRFTAEMNDLKNQANLRSKEFELFKKSVEQQKQQEIQKTAMSLKNDFQKKIDALEISKLKDINEKENIWNLKFQNVIKSYQEEINELKLESLKGKIINSKYKGESFEKEVQEELQKVFGSFDRIEKANFSIDNTKPDFIHHVKNANNKITGTIIYEVKDAEWKNSWEDKLYSDVMKNGGIYGILVSTKLQEHYSVPFKKSDKYENIWLTDRYSYAFLAQILRMNLIVNYNYKNEIEKLKLLNNDDDNLNEIMKEYNQKVDQLDNFWKSEAAKAFLICHKELNNLDSINRNLNSQSQKLLKAKDRIRKQLDTKIISGLEKILGYLAYTEDIDLV